MRRAREIWVEIIRQFEASGLSQTEFAKQRGIPMKTLSSWVYKLRHEEKEGALLPVRVISSTALSARRSKDDGAATEVELGDPIRLHFPTGTAPRLIAEVVALLRTRC